MKLGYFEKGLIREDEITFVVIGARYEDQWLFVRHKDRTTWEIPGGHVEPGESLETAAERELREETGAVDFEIHSILDYTVTKDHQTTSGRLFYAKVKTLENLNQDVEIAEVSAGIYLPEDLTYPDIQPHLHKTLEKFHNAL